MSRIATEYIRVAGGRGQDTEKTCLHGRKYTPHRLIKNKEVEFYDRSNEICYQSAVPMLGPILK